MGGEQQAVPGPDHAVAVGAEVEALAPVVLAALVVLDAGDVAQGQLAVLVVALELGLHPAGRVVQDEVVAASRGAVAAAGDQFPAPESRQGLLVRQAPGGQVQGVVHPSHDDGPIEIAVVEVHDDFLAHAWHVGAAHLVARPLALRAHPAGAALVPRAISVPEKLELDAAQRVGMDVGLGRVGVGPAHDGRLRPVRPGFGLGEVGAQGLADGLHR